MTRPARSAPSIAPPSRAGSPLLGFASDPPALFKIAKAYIGFRREDSALLASFYGHAERHVPRIISDFYARIEADPGAARVITGGEAQVEHLKKTLCIWLVRFLKGPHNADFARRQALIGRKHVKVGLQEAYMVVGTNVIRDGLDRVLLKSFSPGSRRATATQRAYTKLLDIVLALMIEAYREDHVKQILQTEQSATMRRLASLGEVAASIAHEVRNPLAGISGAIQVMSDQMKADDPQQRILSDVIREIRRLDERVNDLLLYARPSVLNREMIRPRDVLLTTVGLLSEDPRFEKVDVSLKAPSDLPSFPVDVGQLQQVLMNLVLNSAQAMNGSGWIRLTTRLLNGGALEISVEDSGPGVPEETGEEIFQPFFTTRSGGTGLGLAISRKIVESHGGILYLRSGRRGRAQFVLALPYPPEEESIHTPVG
jgi:signal transduction histidine kinase